MGTNPAIKRKAKRVKGDNLRAIRHDKDALAWLVKQNVLTQEESDHVGTRNWSSMSSTSRKKHDSKYIKKVRNYMSKRIRYGGSIPDNIKSLMNINTKETGTELMETTTDTGIIEKLASDLNMDDPGAGLPSDTKAPEVTTLPMNTSTIESDMGQGDKVGKGLVQEVSTKKSLESVLSSLTSHNKTTTKDVPMSDIVTPDKPKQDNQAQPIESASQLPSVDSDASQTPMQPQPQLPMTAKQPPVVPTHTFEPNSTSCPQGTQPVSSSTITPTIPGIAPRPAMDPNATTVQPGTLGYQQPQSTRAPPKFAEDIARTAKGDIIKDVQTYEPYEPDMRPEYGMAKAGQVIPSTRKQLESDIRFDMFDHVKPGFGEGMDNKLFLMQEARDKQIVHAPGLHAPGQWIGPTAGVDVPPWQWQRVIPESQIRAYQQDERARTSAGDQLLMTNGPRSSNILGDDIGYPMPYSASELKRNPYSPFEPVIRTDMHWQHVKEPIGAKLNRKRMRLETDAQRYPRALDSYVAGQGGTTLPKRRSLEVILP